MKLCKAVFLIGLAIIFFLLSPLFAQDLRPSGLGSSDLPAEKPADIDSEPDITFPYVGQITGNNINLRSGPGMNYYSCGKVSSPDKVVVVEQKYIWSRILPPVGSFSWIFKKYVSVDANKPQLGIVSADDVRVYAGAEDRAPMRCDSIQILIAKGSKVRIIGEPVGDYYKIAPPEGACLWTSSQYIKFLRSAEDLEVELPKPVEEKQLIAPAAVPDEKPKLLLEQIEARSINTEKYYQLEAKVQDEKAKPLAEQNYEAVKKQLADLADDPNSGQAGSYAKYLLKDIERCQLVIEAQKTLACQQQDTATKLKAIEENYVEKQENKTGIGRYAVVGVFKPSLVYEDKPMVKRFIISDEKGVPICFAEPQGELAVKDFTEFNGKKVGLLGSIGSDAQSKLALVKFEAIDILEEAAKE